MTPGDRFARAVEHFARAHHEDPTVEAGVPAAVTYHRRVAEWIDALAPDASEALRLAARCQHLRRWQIPRASFAEGPTGYKQWRARLAQKHAEEAAAVLREAGYDGDTVERVRGLLIKKGLRSSGPDSDVQLLEDAVCLTFLEQQLAGFAARHAEDKIVDIVRKTWAKMGPRGRAAAGRVLPRLSVALRRLVERAVEGTS